MRAEPHSASWSEIQALQRAALPPSGRSAAKPAAGVTNPGAGATKQGTGSPLWDGTGFERQKRDKSKHISLCSSNRVEIQIDCPELYYIPWLKYGNKILFREYRKIKMTKPTKVKVYVLNINNRWRCLATFLELVATSLYLYSRVKPSANPFGVLD